MPPPGYEPFLAAACARPADDTPRLVYADWLDDQGDADRAEFVRLQVDLARRPPAGENDTRDERAAGLLAANRLGWASELPGGLDLWDHPFVWSRGLPATVGVSGRGGVFAREAATVFRTLPVDGLFVHFLLNDDAWAVVLARPELAAVRRLAVAYPIGDAGAELLALCPNTGRLEELDLSSTGILDRGGSALAASPRLAGLRRLSLDWNRLTSPVLDALRQRFGDGVSARQPNMPW